VQYEHHPDFQLNPNYSLSTALKISAFDAMLGTVKRIIAVNGATIDLTVPAATAPGTVFKVRGHGLYMPNTGARSDMMVHVEVEIPRIDDPNLVARLREIANAIK
jgi:DnaJ-class molecular chaperone